ncbi:MAG: anti-sigma factor antagonist [Bacteroidales bacterium]|nr:anti-sigma factor antagonist [Bacteroidales bacterium]
MDIILDEKSSVAIPVGRLDANNSNDFEKALQTLLENGKHLIVDMSQCPYLSSAGIRILLKTKKQLLAKQGELIIASLSPEVFQVIEMAGLHRIFRIEDNVETSKNLLNTLQDKTAETISFDSDAEKYTFKASGIENYKAKIWKDDDIAGYNELGFSVGFGAPAETHFENSPHSGLFVTAAHCAAFIPGNQDHESDFRVSDDPSRAGILLGQAISFPEKANGMLRMEKTGKVSLSQLAKALEVLNSKHSDKAELLLSVILNKNPDLPSVTVALLVNKTLDEIVTSNRLNAFQQKIASGECSMIGATFLLSELNKNKADITLNELLNEALSIENIMGVQALNPDEIIEEPELWIFMSKDFAEASSMRLKIETAAEMTFEPHKAFLTRRLYTDSARIVIKALHGGFSAQTFQVTSFDQEGRKMRPTVLKIANRAMITRESERCQQYALPYIFNNSAMVLGTEFYGDMGVLRYNFVGIGGESSQLKWLTHYYHQSDMDFLEPLFDKIFLKILKPWYGQAVKKTIYPFKDHDPTFTFFPFIFDTVRELFAVSADEKYIQIPESKIPILNPYWFLKHEFARHRDLGFDYFSGICHGDLNMQNILLDETMNVYLIDFSETKNRAIISDFARLEAIFLVDNAPLENEADMEDYLNFIHGFYKTDQLNAVPEITYSGRHQEKVLKNAKLSLKMRAYAFESVGEDPNPVPYYLALLEWVLPIACYIIPMPQRRLSMIVSSILCEKVMAAMPEK